MKGELTRSVQTVDRDPDELVGRYLADPRPDLRDHIVLMHGDMVTAIARKYAGTEPAEDLEQVGFIGLLNALTKFDQGAGVRFSSYAGHLVAGEIRHYIRDRGHLIRQPARVQELAFQVRRAERLLSGNLMRPPSAGEIASSLGLGEHAVSEALASREMAKVGSLDISIDFDDSDVTEIDRLDAADFCPDQIAIEDRAVLHKAMEELRDLEKQVLVLFHFDELSQTEIAHRLGISCNYVSHILRQCLKKMRNLLISEERKDRILRRQESANSFEILDEETGAYTSEYFRGRLEEEVHRSNSTGCGVALVMVEFLRLEAMGRFYGAEGLSCFLADAAEFLRANFRRLDLICRLDRARFGVILPSTGAGVSSVHRRLIERAAGWAQDRSILSGNVSVRIGRACAPDDGRTVAALMRAAKDESALPKAA